MSPGNSFTEAWLAQYQGRHPAAPPASQATVTPSSHAGDIRLALPFPPSTNKIWRPGVGTTKDGQEYIGLFKRQPYRDWRAVAQRAVGEQRAGKHLHDRFGIEITVGVNRLDPDTCIKPVLDACQHGGAVRNDRFLRRLVLDVRAATPDNLVWVRLWPISESG